MSRARCNIEGSQFARLLSEFGLTAQALLGPAPVGEEHWVVSGNVTDEMWAEYIRNPGAARAR